MIFSLLLTFNRVSCCPANEASGKSSAVADDLTAKLISSLGSIKASSPKIAWFNSSGKGVFKMSSLISAPVLVSSEIFQHRDPQASY